METNRNPGGLIIGAIICILIAIGSIEIAYDTYKKINYKTDSIDETLSRIDNRTSQYSTYSYNLYSSDWKRDTWYKVRTRQESNHYAILYASSFIFSVSLFCFTNICIKSYS